MTAYHESGHAIVGMSLPKCDPVYKATIIPRGGALGHGDEPAGNGPPELAHATSANSASP